MYKAFAWFKINSSKRFQRRNSPFLFAVLVPLTAYHQPLSSVSVYSPTPPKIKTMHPFVICCCRVMFCSFKRQTCITSQFLCIRNPRRAQVGWSGSRFLTRMYSLWQDCSPLKTGLREDLPPNSTGCRNILFQAPPQGCWHISGPHWLSAREFVSWDCLNKLPQTIQFKKKKTHRGLLSHSSEARSSKSVSAGPHSPEAFSTSTVISPSPFPAHNCVTHPFLQILQIAKLQFPCAPPASANMHFIFSNTHIILFIFSMKSPLKYNDPFVM